MKFRVLILGCLFFGTMILIDGCKKDDPVEPIDNGDTIKVDTATKVIVVTNEVNNLLKSKSGDQLIFEKNAETEQFKVGDILVSGIHENAPFGYLRKLAAISQQGNQVIIETKATSLPEAIIDGGGEFSKAFDISDTISGKRLTAFEIDLEKDLLAGQVNVAGSLKVTPTLDGGLVINKGKYTLAYFELKLSSEFYMAMHANFTGPISEEYTIRDIPLSPITIPGVIPIVLRPSIVFRAGVDGTASLDMRTDYSKTSDLTIIIKHDKQDGWFQNTRQDITETYNEPTIKGAGSMQGYVSASLEIALYDEKFIEVGMSTKLYGQLDASLNDMEDEILWDLTAGVSGSASINAYLLGLDLGTASYDDLFGINTSIANSTIKLYQFDLVSPLHQFTDYAAPHILRWEEFTDQSGEKYAYSIHLGTAKSPDRHEFVPRENFEREIKNLDPATKYYWHIVAINGSGEEKGMSQKRWFVTQ